MYWKKWSPEYKTLLKLGSPILMSQLGVILLSFTDTLMVGHYGVDELAAAAFVNSVYLVTNVMMMGLTGGVTPLVGALYSQGDNYNVGRITRGAIQVNVAAAVIFTLLMGAVYFLLPYFGQEERLNDLISEYYLILLPQPLIIAFFFVIVQCANGITYTSLPMWITFIMVILNIIGNYILIYGHWGFPELGLAGAGYATMVSRIIALLCIWIAFRFFKKFSYYQKGFLERGHLGQIRRKVWNTSWPIMIQNGLECLLWSVGAVVVGWFGAVQLAAYQIVNTVGQLGFMIFMSFGTAVAIRVANFAGLNDEKGAGHSARAGVHINIFLATIVSIIFIFAGRELVMLFVDNDPEAIDSNAVIASALGLIVPLIVYQYNDAIQITMCNAIRGTSQVKPLMWISLVSYVIVGIPFLLLFAKVMDLGNIGAYWSFCVALLAACVMAVYIFRKIKFKEPLLPEERN